MDKVSVFGSTGYIGRNFCKAFPSKVIPIERASRLPESNSILYLLSTTHNYNVYNDTQIDIDTNLKILMEVLENCKNKNVVFNYVSSWFVYGNSRLPASESDYCDPKGFYSITKRCAEQLIESFCSTFNIPYRILRLSNIYGETDPKASSQKNAIQHMLNKIKNNETVKLYEGGYVLRDLLHVSDLCEALKIVLENGKLNDIYNIGSGKPLALRNIMEMAKKHTGSASSILSTDTPDFHKQVQARDSYLNVSKLKGLGFIPKINISKGIQMLCSPSA